MTVLNSITFSAALYEYGMKTSFYTNISLLLNYLTVNLCTENFRALSKWNIHFFWVEFSTWIFQLIIEIQFISVCHEAFLRQVNFLFTYVTVANGFNPLNSSRNIKQNEMNFINVCQLCERLIMISCSELEKYNKLMDYYCHYNSSSHLTTRKVFLKIFYQSNWDFKTMEWNIL